MKIFVITSRVPYPLEKGDKLRIYHQLKELSRSHEIMLCAVDTEGAASENIDHLKEFCKEVMIIRIPKWKIALQLFAGIFSSKPFQIHYYFDPAQRKSVQQIVHRFQPDIIHCHLIRVAEYVRKIDIPKSIDYMDVFSKGLSRRVDKQPFYLRWIFKMESDRVKKYESEVFNDFDFQTIISEQDRDLIDHPKSSQIEIIRNGVSTEFFKPFIAEKKYDLLFTGNMNYQPNIDAVLYLHEHVLPLLKEEFPNLSLMISGTDPAKQVLALKNENVMVSGWVDDIRKMYAAAKVFIAPMQIGTGLQNKLLEAMSMEIPCITSSLANEALRASDETEVLVCDQPEEYAAAIRLLLKNEIKRTELANKGREFVINSYNWTQSTGKLETLFAKIIK